MFHVFLFVPGRGRVYVTFSCWRAVLFIVRGMRASFVFVCPWAWGGSCFFVGGRFSL